jgi:hypothetical protein
LAVVVFVVLLARAAAALDPYPYPIPPAITNVMTSHAVPGAVSFSVFATIQGQEQLESQCDIEPVEDCESEDWYFISDPHISPNPPTIQEARVYYYFNGEIGSTSSVGMVYDAGLNKWSAPVPLSGADAGDIVTFFIRAVDSRGNVASEAPDPGTDPCPSIDVWDAKYATPVTSSCSYATSYSRCVVNDYSGTPSPCMTNTFTLADMYGGDVCGEPDASGYQSVIYGPAADRLDITGMTVGAGGNFLCVRMGLSAAPSSIFLSPIERYELVILNPDLPDPNPADLHAENSYFAMYAPEVASMDPTLVKVLWDGDCLSNPDTPDSSACKLISAVADHPNLKMNYSNGSLYFKIKTSGIGEVLTVPFDLIGNTSKETWLGVRVGSEVLYEEIVWENDVSQVMRFYHDNHDVQVSTAGTPMAPMVTATTCSVDGSGGSGSACAQSADQPAQNTCKIVFNRSLDYGITTYYRIYRNTQNSFEGATLVNTITQTSDTTYSYSDTLATMDGATYYYFLTSYRVSGALETPGDEAAATACTVEDWAPPVFGGVQAAQVCGSGCLNLSWQTAVDINGAPPITYNVYLAGSSHAQDFFSPAQGATTDLNLDISGLTEGMLYYFVVRAQDSVGNLESNLVELSGIPDNTEPSAIPEVNDGPGADMAFAPSDTTLIANWSEAEDPETGIARYWYAIGTAPGLFDIQDWTDNGSVTIAAASGLALVQDQTYYVTVKAQNGAGLQSVPTTSNGQTVDLTPPGPITSVDHGAGDSMAYSTNTAEIFAQWSESTDPDSGVAHYVYALGTAPGTTDVTGFTDAGAATSALMTGLGLTSGQAYYVTVKAQNSAGLFGDATSSGGITIDTTPPLAPEFVNDGADTEKDADTSGSFTELSANWAQAADPESGAAYYNVAVGAGTCASVVAATTTTQTAITVSGLSLALDTTYIISVQAVNRAGLAGDTQCSNGVVLDVTPPATATTFTAVSAFQQVLLSWTLPTGDDDFESIALVRKAGAYPGSATDGELRYNGAATTYLDTGLTSDDTYYYTLFTCDDVGNCSPAHAVARPAVPAMSLAPGWNLISLSIDPVSGDPAQVFSGLDVRILGYAEGGFVESDAPGFSAMAAGSAYWVYTPEAVEGVSIAGEAITEPWYEIPLTPGWNLISNPYSNAVPWSDERITVQEEGGNVLPITQAATLVEPFVYYFDPATDVYYAMDPAFGYPLVPWKGYWLRAIKACTLSITEP